MKNKNFNEIFNFETLFCTMKNCAKGVIWKEKVQNYIKNYAKNLSQLLYSLQNETYKIDPVFDFILSEKGKKRHITPYDIKDRIVQRCLCDEYLVPLLSKSLIYDCPATRKNMGLEFSKKGFFASNAFFPVTNFNWHFLFPLLILIILKI